MHDFFKRVFGLGLVATILTAPAAIAQAPPGVLVVGQIAEPKSLDPHAVTAVNDFRILMNLYDGLVRYRDGTLEVEPALATSWSISDDGTEYTFELRSGVTFHDGTPFNAQAVKSTVERSTRTTRITTRVPSRSRSSSPPSRTPRRSTTTRSGSRSTSPTRRSSPIWRTRPG